MRYWTEAEARAEYAAALETRIIDVIAEATRPAQVAGTNGHAVSPNGTGTSHAGQGPRAEAGEDAIADTPTRKSTSSSAGCRVGREGDRAA